MVYDNRLLAGRNVLITGAGRNVGRGIALEMAAQGANVLFTDIDAARIAEVTQALASGGATARGLVSDITRPADVQDLVAELDSVDSAIDVLVNNVGTERLEDTGVLAYDPDGWRQTFAALCSSRT